jgi:hypothetical protein
MTDRLTSVLAALSDADLAQLRFLADDAHGQTTSLLAAISHAAEGEFHRCGGVDFQMLPRGDAIDEGDLDAAHRLAVAFHSAIAGRFQSPQVVRDLMVRIRWSHHTRNWTPIAAVTPNLEEDALVAPHRTR